MHHGPVHQIDRVAEMTQILDSCGLEHALPAPRARRAEHEEARAHDLPEAVFLAEPRRDQGAEVSPAWHAPWARIGTGEQVQCRDGDEGPKRIPGQPATRRRRVRVRFLAERKQQRGCRRRRRRRTHPAEFALAMRIAPHVEVRDGHAREEEQHVPPVAPQHEPRQQAHDGEPDVLPQPGGADEDEEEHHRAPELERDRPQVDVVLRGAGVVGPAPDVDEGPHLARPVRELRGQRAQARGVVLDDVAGEPAVRDEVARPLERARAQQQRHAQRGRQRREVQAEEAAEDERGRRPGEGLGVPPAREPQRAQGERVPRYHEEDAHHRRPAVE